MAAAAIVAAGGRGERARGARLKQFQKLGGRPLISHSLDVLAEAGCDPIIVVVPEDSLAAATRLLGGGVTLVAGGASRRESVRNGLSHVTTEHVVVHDAVRPFVSSRMIECTLASLADADGAIVATPLDETLKRVEGDTVEETVSRAHLWLVQTPQSFRSEALRSAHDRAAAEGLEATDDASLIERYGGRVVVVHGSRANIKLTYPEDFTIAEAILRRNS